MFYVTKSFMFHPCIGTELLNFNFMALSCRSDYMSKPVK